MSMCQSRGGTPKWWLSFWVPPSHKQPRPFCGTPIPRRCQVPSWHSTTGGLRPDVGWRQEPSAGLRPKRGKKEGVEGATPVSTPLPCKRSTWTCAKNHNTSGRRAIRLRSLVSDTFIASWKRQWVQPGQALWLLQSSLFGATSTCCNCLGVPKTVVALHRSKVGSLQ